MYKKQVFIAPGSREHINKSVIPYEGAIGRGRLTSLEGLIPIETIADTLTDEEKKKLYEIFPDKKVRMWGTRPALKRVWDSMKKGDYVIFYSNNYYICAAEAVFKTDNEKLAEKVWGKYKTGETWNYIFFVKNVRQLNMHRKDFNKKATYKENFVPQGLMRVANDVARDRILSEIISKEQSDVISLPPKVEEFIKEWKNDPETQAWLERKNKAFEKWKVKFSAENVDKLSRDEFRTFLRFNENQSWDGIQRQPHVYKDMAKLRRTIKYLTKGLNDATLEEIGTRISNSLDDDGDYKIKGLGRAVVTGIIHICDTKNRIGVWNAKVEEAFRKLDLPIPKGSGSNGPRYLQFNHILNLIGRKYDLNLRQVDMLMYQIAEKYQPTAVYTFSFVPKDFDSCTGKKNDARYLNKRFKTLLNVLKENLDPNFLNDFTKSYVARPFNQGSKKYRKHMWLGLAHGKLKDKPQKCIQFQVSINPNDPFSIDIFIDRAGQKMREKAKLNVEKNKTLFLKLVNSLTSYLIGYTNKEQFSVETDKMTKENLEGFLEHMDGSRTQIYLSKIMSKEEVISKGPLIVNEIITTWKELLPIYKLMAFGQSERLLTLDEIDKTAIVHLIAGRNLIFYGPPGTGKTRKAVRIARLFCGEDDNSFSFVTANAEWTTYDVVGGPTLAGERKLMFKPGFLVLAAIECSRSLKSSGFPHFLIIDEINRANLDLAFGKIFSLLDMEYRDQPILDSSELLGMENAEEYRNIKIPKEFRILATMNTYDTALLFSLGYAFRRRFAFIEIGSPFIGETKEKYELNEKEWSALEIHLDDRIGDLSKEIENWISKAVFLRLPPSLKLKLGLPEEFDLTKSMRQINNKIKNGEVDPFNPYKLACSLSEIMTEEKIIEAGYAQAVDFIKYALVYAAIFSKEKVKVDLVKAMDEAVKAYFIPQIEYYLPRARRRMTIGRKEEAEEAIGKLNKIETMLGKLGLIKSSEKLKVIITNLKAGETRLF